LGWEEGRCDVQIVTLEMLKNAPKRAAIHTPGLFPLKQVATGSLKARKSGTKTLSYSFPLGETASGEYILAVIDGDNTVVEADESNN